MTKRSLFLTVAAGLLASVAFATPSQAASQTINTLVTLTVTDAGFLSDFSVQYATPPPGSLGVDPISSLTLVSASPALGTVALIQPSPTNNTVIASFSNIVAGTGMVFLDWSFVTATPGTIDAVLSGVSGSSTGYTDSVVVTSVPEPTSLALLGIGMTGFLAFRRLFKRPLVA
jgi:hypothetical protein